MRRPLILLLAVALRAAPLAAAEPVVLRVGVDTRTPPWCFVPGLDYSKEDPTKDPAATEAQLKKAEGLDVDVAGALGRRLHAAIKIVPVAWFDMEKGLLARRYDLIVGGWTPNSKTSPAIFASTPYYEWGLLIAVRADNPKVRGYQDLAGTAVGFYRDSVAERTVRSLKAGAAIPYDSQEVLFEDLRTSKIAAVLFDSLYVRWRIANDPTFRAVGEPLNRLGYHVGVRKEDAALVAGVEAAVEDLLASGEMDRIRKKWEGAK